jgi:hypothetical protein
MGAGRNRTMRSSANNFPPFRLDTVNECLWLRGGRQGGWYRIGNYASYARDGSPGNAEQTRIEVKRGHTSKPDNRCAHIQYLASFEIEDAASAQALRQGPVV